MKSGIVITKTKKLHNLKKSEIVKEKICLENLPPRTMNRNNFILIFLFIVVVRPKLEGWIEIKKRKRFHFYKHFNILTMMWPVLCSSFFSFTKFSVVASRLTFNTELELSVSFHFSDIYHISKGQ